MQNPTPTMERTGTQAWSPVDNLTYDLLQTLTSKLEAIEVYTKYLNDADGETRQFFESCRESDRRTAEQCLQLLRGRLGRS